MSVMLCKEVFPKDLGMMEKSEKWGSQDKVDGDHFKIICKNVIGNNTTQKIIRLINRHGNDYTRQFPEIVAGLGVRKGNSVILNAELSYFNEITDKWDFNIFRGRQGLQKDKDIMRRRLRFPCKAYVFDLIECNGENMINNPNYPFSKRYEILKNILINNNVTEVLPIRHDLVTHFKEACEKNREGIVVKNLDNIYIEGRSQSILKCKNWNYSKIKFEDFEDNNAGITITNEEGDRVLVAGKKAELVKATIIQMGYTYEWIRHLQTRTENGRLREGTHYEHIGNIDTKDLNIAKDGKGFDIDKEHIGVIKNSTH